jgi:hypothetical protein
MDITETLLEMGVDKRIREIILMELFIINKDVLLEEIRSQWHWLSA